MPTSICIQRHQTSSESDLTQDARILYSQSSGAVATAVCLQRCFQLQEGSSSTGKPVHCVTSATITRCSGLNKLQEKEPPDSCVERYQKGTVRDLTQDAIILYTQSTGAGATTVCLQRCSHLHMTVWASWRAECDQSLASRRRFMYPSRPDKWQRLVRAKVD